VSALNNGGGTMKHLEKTGREANISVYQVTKAANV